MRNKTGGAYENKIVGANCGHEGDTEQDVTMYINKRAETSLREWWSGKVRTMVKRLIQKGVNLHAGGEEVLRVATPCRHLRVVEYRVGPDGDICAEDEMAFAMNREGCSSCAMYGGEYPESQGENN